MGNKSSSQALVRSTDYNKQPVYAPGNSSLYSPRDIVITSGTDMELKKNITSIVSKEKTDSKWRPNDELSRVYNSFSSQASKLRQYKKELVDMEQKKKALQEQVDSYVGKELDIDDRLNLSQIKQQLIDISTKADGYSKRIDSFSHVNSEIIEIWDSYYNGIAQLINDYDLGEFTNVTMLVSSQNIYTHYSCLYRELLNSRAKEEVQYKLDRLTKAIDMNYVMANINNQNIEYAKLTQKIDVDMFGIQNPIVPTAKLLEEVYKEVQKLPSNKQVLMVDNNAELYAKITGIVAAELTNEVVKQLL